MTNQEEKALFTLAHKDQRTAQEEKRFNELSDKWEEEYNAEQYRNWCAGQPI